MPLPAAVACRSRGSEEMAGSGCGRRAAYEYVRLLDLTASRSGANAHSKLNALVQRQLLVRTTPTGDLQAHFSTARPMRRHDVFSAGYLGRSRTRSSRLHPIQSWWGMYWAKGSICVHIWDRGKAPLGPIRSLNVSLSFITHLAHYPFHPSLLQPARQAHQPACLGDAYVIIRPMMLLLLLLIFVSAPLAPGLGTSSRSRALCA